MTERRYNEDEVAAIFRGATEETENSVERPAPTANGMTLGELEDIGRQVGIAPAVIRQAARSLDAGEQRISRTFLGLPLGVGHTIELDRRLSEDEWERLVVDLRETFDARGTVRREGGLRQWTNGNLQALLEPTATGQRLRLRTVKGDARGMLTGGMMVFGIGALALLASVATGLTSDLGRMTAELAVAGTGLAMFSAAALRLPNWARERRQQMEAIAARLMRTLPAEASPDSD
jgi:hypothetical protein